MLEDIYILGKEYSKLTGDFPDFIQNPRVDEVLCISFTKKNGELKYDGITFEEFREDEYKKYCYRRLTSRSEDFTPSSKLNKGDKIKTLERFKRWFQNNPNIINIDEDQFSTKGKIGEDLRDIEIDKKKKYLLTLKIGNKYIGEIIPKEWFINKIRERFFEGGGSSICQLCNQRKEVGGKFSLSMLGLEFCNFDKKGFAPSFSQRDSWKEIPICFDCMKFIEYGKSFLDEFLRIETPIGKLSYYIIPSFIFKKSEAIQKFLEKVRLSSYQIENEITKGLIMKEDRLYDLVKEIGDWIRFNFLFFTKEQSRFLIHSYVNDVKPSWINRIFDIEEKCRKEWIFQEAQMKKIFGKKYKNSFLKKHINLRNKKIVWWVQFLHFIYSTKKEYVNTLSNILSNKKISFDLFIHNSIIYLQNTFKNDIKNLNRNVLQTLAIFLFLKRLNLFRMDKNIKNIFSKESNEFFDKYKELFSNNEQKIAFLLGVLGNYVLYVQYLKGGYKFGEEPFRKEFNNLLINKKRLKKILVKCVEKLAQYKKGIPTWFSENLINYLNTKDLNLSTDEISYFFTLGLVCGNLLFKKNEKGGENE